MMPIQTARLFRTLVLSAALPPALTLGTRCFAQTAPAAPSVAAHGASAVTPRFTARPSNYVELPEANAAGETSRGAKEGIQVHGHWKIDVKNPDGTLASSHEFENHLVSADFVVGALAGYYVPGDWDILLISTTGVSPCGSSSGTTQGCAIVHNLATLPASFDCQLYVCTSTLTYNPFLAGIGGGGAYLQLTGQITATVSSSIGLVETDLSACQDVSTSGGSPTTPTSITPSACAAGSGGGAVAFGQFSATTLTSPISVIGNQVIQVTVTFTFS
jgi:hypothetical protein